MIRLLLAAALLLAPVPASAQGLSEDEVDALPACTAWSAQFREDEGGAVFTAAACASDRPDAYLLMTCSAGTIFMRYDLAAGAERSPGPGESAGVDFTIGVSTQRVAMQHEEMDGMFAARVPAAGPLVALMASGEVLRIADGAGIYPEHTFRLAGSASALKALLARCR
ncbi:MAG: hypothetical protein J0I99_10305 [Devosia sp.]|uniref:hypothetical protein n=1 Tax=Devosia sp. TaxID=1871048 RepID=UPI001ACEF07B|nr:hypothetical protein [Devosia sp.]MBN9316120.1 hypothetical protein [Devosia sp.]